MRLIVILAAFAACFAVATTSRAESPQEQQTQIWCIDYLHYSSPAPHHYLTARCQFVRLDDLAGEDLFAVWATDHGPRGNRLYFACVWFDGNQETTFVRVARVGDQGGVKC